MSLLGQLWVKLGLKDEEFKAGLDSAQGKAEGFGDGIKKVSNAVKVAWAAVGAAVVKLGTDMVKQTQVIGDKWGIFAAGITAAYNEFVSRIGSGAGWDNLIADMREASRVAKEVQMSLDELFERNNSLSIQEAKKQTEIEKYKQQMRDVSLTDEQRIAAGEKAMALEKELLQMRKDVAKQEADAYKQILQQRTKMTDADLQYFVENYNGNREQIQQAIAYRDTLELTTREIENARVFESQAIGEAKKGWKEKAELLEQNRAELIATTSDELKAIADLASRYDLSNDEMIENYVRALIKMENAGTQYYRETTRMVTMLSTLNKNAGTEGGEALGIAGQSSLFAAVNAQIKGSTPTLNVKSPAMVDFSQLNFEGVDKMGELTDEMRTQAEKAQEAANMFAGAVQSGIVSSLDMLAEAVANGEKISFGQLVSQLLTPIADASISAGMMILTTGEGVEAFKASLESLQGAPAIIAGAALIGIGTAAKAGLKALGKNPTNASSYSSTYSGGYGVSMADLTTNVQVEVAGVLRGQDIYLASEKYQQNKRR